jgi:hypothetical protein
MCRGICGEEAYQNRGLSLATGMEIGYEVRDAAKWDVDPERDASEFEAGYYGKLLVKAWDEVTFVLLKADYIYWIEYLTKLSQSFAKPKREERHFNNAMHQY